MSNLIGYVIAIAVAWFIIGKILQSRGIALGDSRFFNIKWVGGVLVAGLAYVWGILEEGFISLGGLF